jgi:hypothetical protein
MLKNDRAPVKLVWPGGAPAGEGVFTDTGEYPNTYPKFFARYNRGEPLILPGTEGQGQGVRAQLVGAGRGEGHVETGLSPCLMRAAKDPNNKWKITEDDVSERKVTADGVRAIDLTLMDFMALYGAEGVGEAMAVYGSGGNGGTGGGVQPRPGSDSSAEVRRLLLEVERVKKEAGEYMASLDLAREKLADSIQERENTAKEAMKIQTRTANLLSTLEARSRGMKKSAGGGGGKYAEALRKAAEGLEKTVADFRAEKAGTP